MKKFEAHQAEVTSVAFSPDDQILATGDARGHVKLWKIDEGRVVSKLEGHTRRISAIAFLPDGSRVLTASSDKTVGQWDVASGPEIPNLIMKHPDSILAMQAIPGENSIVTSCADRRLRIWNVDETKSCKRSALRYRRFFAQGFRRTVNDYLPRTRKSEPFDYGNWTRDAKSNHRKPGGTLRPHWT